MIATAIGTFAALGGPGLGERRGPPVEELAVEKTKLTPGIIELTVRNDGPDAVSIAQAQVNDAYVEFSGAEGAIGHLRTATLRIEQPWIEGEAYSVALVTSTGATIAHEIPAAVETPTTDAGFFGLMALLGLYVGNHSRDARHAVASLAAPRPAGVAAGAHGRDRGAAGVPGHRRHARGPRAGR